MKAIVVRQAGGPEVLKLEEVPKPQVKPGWSLVKIKGFGINHSEIFTRRGLSPSVKFPRILGIECVGVIDQTTDPARLPLGQQVVSIMGEMGRAFDGSYAEYALLPNKQLYPIHSDLSWADLAAIPETYYTAYGSMLNLKIKSSDRILVRGSSSGVGIVFLRLVKAKDPSIFVAGTTRKADKADLMRKIGYDAVVLDQNGHLQTSQKFDKVLELIGPKTVKDSFKFVNHGGIVCSTGELGDEWYLDKFDPITDIAAGAYLTGFYSGDVNEQKLNEMLDYVYIPSLPGYFPWNADAHRYLEGKQSFGKVVVVE